MEALMSVSVVILAAGQGTRMRSEKPKVLHPLMGKPMIKYSVDNALSIAKKPPVVVIGHGQEKVRQLLAGADVSTVVQEEQLGTGHAVQQARSELENRSEHVLVLYADMPLLRPETLHRLIEVQANSDGPLTMLSMIEENPRGFGRVVRDPAGNIRTIVEEAQAGADELRIKELNAGVYCLNSDWLWKALDRVTLSPAGEYYLTDLVGIAVSEGETVSAVVLEDNREAIGINNRIHLAEAAGIMRERINKHWMREGVTLIEPERTYIESSVEIGYDTEIWPDCYLKGNTRIGSNNIIGPGTSITDSKIGEGCLLFQVVIEEATVENEVVIGPFSHMRKGAHIASGVHIGNYGEVKNSYLGTNTKMGHFSYIGDAEIGENVNIGAGTITCNFDGKQKNRTRVGPNVFIGSDTMLVAPVELGESSRTGAGSVVTKDVPAHTLVTGVPARAIRKFKSNE
jgi:bifunctional UDP-N-acetylglucosamine pyrophosphorylase/glucosamine-1-phosphate N-acetyltransferase